MIFCDIVAPIAVKITIRCPIATHNVTDSALLVKKSRRTIQRYIANGKLSVTRDRLGNPQIDTAELLRVFGALSKVSQKKINKKSQNVAPNLSHKNDDDRMGKLLAAVERLEKVVEKQSEQISSLLKLEHKPIVEQVASNKPAEYQVSKLTPSRTKTLRVKKKKAKNGYASAFGLPSEITEQIHLKIMELHAAGATSREIKDELPISKESIQRIINAIQ